jgi:hypothetical protein
MKAITLLAAAAAMALTPTSTFAAPGGNGSTNGVGWIHWNGPDEGQTGQQFLECGEDGPTPGNAGEAPGGGSAFADEEVSVAGAHYAGEQPQNWRNTASVSQYDTACANQPR